MRANSSSFWKIRSEKAASLGAISRSTAWNSGVFIVELQTPKTLSARSSVRPVPSSAAMVFSKVAGAGFVAIFSISASCSAMAVSSAGCIWATSTRSNGGTPP
jgi:hypothetical protein